MRIVGTRKQYQVSLLPSGAALKAGAAIQDTALALAVVPTTGVRRGIYRFATHAQANAHAEEALTRAIAENLIARKLVP